MLDKDTIVAIATPSGSGGVCIIRISGEHALQIASAITKKELQARWATYSNFYHNDGSVIDQGVALYFQSPHSFTGEDVVELQGHGGVAVAQAILQCCISAGARLAQAGEFTQRAYLNNKMDLAQAEAVADLIAAQTLEAVKAANKSLQGKFSEQVKRLSDEILQLRIYIEAALDFSDEEIDFLAEANIRGKLQQWGGRLHWLIKEAEQGLVLNDGINVVLAGKPNAGKSSLLNYFVGHDRAIVTEKEGTTRDIIKETLQINGFPIHLLDTAGLRESDDIVEKEGIKRTQRAVSEADIILWLTDGSKIDNDHLSKQTIDSAILTETDQDKVIFINTKSDIVAPEIVEQNNAHLWISVKNKHSIEFLKKAILDKIGLKVESEGLFTARERHILALKKTACFYEKALNQLQFSGYEELVAEDLRFAHESLGEIVGRITSDQLLGEIFSGFCIGK